MNAAARLVHQNVLSSRQVLITHLFSWQQVLLGILSLMVLLSALSIIYVTHLSRIEYATYQHQLTEKNHLHILRSQLLLERSTWTMPARIQQVAENELGMVVPDHQSVVIVHE